MAVASGGGPQEPLFLALDTATAGRGRDGGGGSFWGELGVRAGSHAPSITLCGSLMPPPLTLALGPPTTFYPSLCPLSAP